jgi:hypothetical protein
VVERASGATESTLWVMYDVLEEFMAPTYLDLTLTMGSLLRDSSSNYTITTIMTRSYQ